MMRGVVRRLGAAALIAVVGQGAHAQPRELIHSVDDLPRATYSVPGSVAEVLTSSPERFEAFAQPVIVDIKRLMGAYDITDKSTLRTMLKAKLGAEIASGHDDQAALDTVSAIADQQDKLEAKLNGGLVYRAFLEARLAGREAPGVCPAGFGTTYARHLQALPWSVIGVNIKLQKGLAQVATPAFITGFASDLQPTLDRAHALGSRAPGD